MLSVQEAQNQIVSHFKPLDTTLVLLEQSLGYVLADSIRAGQDLPSFDNSSMDGFAVHANDVSAADQNDPVILKVIADIPAGSAINISLNQGQAARIMTGAAIPTGSDAVVMLENTDAYQQITGVAPPASVAVYKSIRTGENIRKRGSDIHGGQEILLSGSILRPQEIGMLAMLGIAQVPVHRKPKIVIVASGDELLPPGANLAPGKIYDSNTFTLAALAQNAGCDVIRLGVAPDRYDAILDILARAVENQPDMIISSAGISVGVFDYVKDVVQSAGALYFWKVNMRPGKPLAFGNFRDIPFFGLPGNPVSSFISFLLFVQPAIERLRGVRLSTNKRIRVFLTEAIESDGRESYLRAIVKHENGKYQGSLTGHQGSSNLNSLVQANALLIIPSGVKSCPPGSELDAWSLENL